MKKGAVSTQDPIPFSPDLSLLLQYAKENIVLKQSEGFVLSNLPTHFTSQNPLKIVGVNLQTSPSYFLINEAQDFLGEGAEGKVYKGLNLVTQDIVAIKEYVLPGKNALTYIAKERQILKKMGMLVGGCRSGGNEYTVMEFCPGENLMFFLYELDDQLDKNDSGYFKAKKVIDFYTLLQLAILAVKGLITLHEKHIVYGDLKTSNFIVEHSHRMLQLKMIDFGSATDISLGDVPETCGTFGYLDPALKSGDVPGFKNDYGSLGIFLAELFTKENFQQALRQKLQACQTSVPQLSFDELYEMMPDIFSPDPELQSNAFYHKYYIHIKSLIRDLLSPQIEKRPDLTQIKAIYKTLVKMKSKLGIQKAHEMSETPRQLFYRGRRNSEPVIFPEGEDVACGSDRGLLPCRSNYSTYRKMGHSTSALTMTKENKFPHLLVHSQTLPALSQKLSASSSNLLEDKKVTPNKIGMLFLSTPFYKSKSKDKSAEKVIKKEASSKQEKKKKSPRQ